MKNMYEEFRKYEVKADSIEDFLMNFTKRGRHEERGKEYVQARIESHNECMNKFGYTFITHPRQHNRRHCFVLRQYNNMKPKLEVFIMALTNNMIAMYDKLTHNNHHGEVLEQMANDFKLNVLAKAFKAVNTIHDIEGYISSDVHSTRERFKQQMKDHLSNILDAEQYKLIRKYI